MKMSIWCPPLDKLMMIIESCDEAEHSEYDV